MLRRRRQISVDSIRTVICCDGSCGWQNEIDDEIANKELDAIGSKTGC